MKAPLCLLALLPFAATDDQFYTVPYSERQEWTGNVNAGDSGQFHLGTGRFAELTVLTKEGGAIGCSDLEVKLAYAQSPVGKHLATCDDGGCDTNLPIVNGQGFETCVTARDGEPERSSGSGKFCTSVYHEVRGDLGYTTSKAIPAVQTTPFVFKAATGNNRKFFVQWKRLPGGTAGCAVTLKWTGRVGVPENDHCVAERDTTEFLARSSEADPMYGNQSSASARLPRLVRDTHVATSVTVGDTPYRKTLGKAPMLDISCLSVYSTPYSEQSAEQSATCRDSQSTSAFDMDSYVSTQNGVTITEYHACSAFTTTSNADGSAASSNINMPPRFYACCSQTKMQDCTALGDDCAWIPDEGQCVPTYQSKSVDVSTLSGAEATTTLSSTYANKGHSAFYPSLNLIKPGQGQTWEVDHNRLWVLEIANKFATSCQQLVTVSYVASPNSGICEPSTRRMCDNAFDECSSGAQKSYFEDTEPKWYNLDFEGSGNYRTCNCLKRKEVCYRKNGCVNTIRYQSTLANCLDVGCGNWCDSAATAQISFLAIFVAAVALLL